jgi:hypothetical protein
MFRRDRRGRLRQPDQERGLRPLYPLLDDGWESRALRVAMPAGLWRLFDQLVTYFPSPTLARSHGEAIAYLLRREQREAAQWLDWDQQKQLRLLSRRVPSAGEITEH